jgi:hypothetical protein
LKRAQAALTLCGAAGKGAFMRAGFGTAAAVALSGLVCGTAFAEPSAAYLEPVLKPGDRQATVFSKARSIKGQGFDEYVGRVSGTATDTITAVAPDALTLGVTYRYDGRPEGAGSVVIRDHGTTTCRKDGCSVDDETSGARFIPYLWGNIPDDIAVGTSWTADIAKPWEIGPKGTERVTVVRLDKDAHLVTLKREGEGDGPSSDDVQGSAKRNIVVGGKTVAVTIAPGHTHWEGFTTIAQGITVSDEIIARRHVTLTADTGDKYEGEERVYTLLIGAPA